MADYDKPAFTWTVVSKDITPDDTFQLPAYGLNPNPTPVPAEFGGGGGGPSSYPIGG